MKFKEIRVNLDTGIVHEYLTPEEEERQRQEVLFARAEELKGLLERKRVRELSGDKKFDDLCGIKETGFRIGSDQHINRIIADSITTIKNVAGTKAVYITGSLDDKFVASLVQTPGNNPMLLDQSKKYAKEHYCVKWAKERLHQHEFKSSTATISRMRRITRELESLHDELSLSRRLEAIDQDLFSTKSDKNFKRPRITLEWRSTGEMYNHDLEVHKDGVLAAVIRSVDVPRGMGIFCDVKRAWRSEK